MIRPSPPDFPTTLFDFIKRFSTEKACWEYLVQMRWKKGVPAHPETGEPPQYFKAPRKIWQFQDGYQMSATVGTVMERTKIPLVKWFWAAYLVATHTPGVSALQLGKQLGMHYETVYMMLQKLRTGLVDPDRTKLKGTVEVDETYIGGRKRIVRGRGALGKSIVVSAVEVIHYRDKHGKKAVRSGRVRLRKIPDASGDSLEGFITDVVEPGTRILTDGWKGYYGLKRAGYRHVTVVGDTPVEVAEGLPHVHRVFGNLKTWILGTHHGVSAKHMQAYLNEFTFRFNRRLDPFHAFKAVLRIGTHVDAPMYEEIYAVGAAGGWKHANPN
jgi:transposase-like protein